MSDSNKNLAPDGVPAQRETERLTVGRKITLRHRNIYVFMSLDKLIHQGYSSLHLVANNHITSGLQAMLKSWELSGTPCTGNNCFQHFVFGNEQFQIPAANIIHEEY
jgi:hypothetical protein